MHLFYFLIHFCFSWERLYSIIFISVERGYEHLEETYTQTQGEHENSTQKESTWSRNWNQDFIWFVDFYVICLYSHCYISEVYCEKQAQIQDWLRKFKIKISKINFRWLSSDNLNHVCVFMLWHQLLKKLDIFTQCFINELHFYKCTEHSFRVTLIIHTKCIFMKQSSQTCPKIFCWIYFYSRYTSQFIWKYSPLVTLQ